MSGRNTDTKMPTEVSNFLGVENHPQILKELIRDYILKSNQDIVSKLFTPFWNKPFKTQSKMKYLSSTVKWIDTNGSVL